MSQRRRTDSLSQIETLASGGLHLVLGFGSNLGSREAFLRAAIGSMASAIPLVAVSNLYRSEAENGDGPAYLNCAAAFQCDDPKETLHHAQRIEHALGRLRPYPSAPRTIDIDLLWWEGGAIDSDDLELPHPRWERREFALGPAQEVGAVPHRPSTSGTVRAQIVHWSRVWRSAHEVRVDAKDQGDALALALGTSAPTPVSGWESASVGSASELVELTGTRGVRSVALQNVPGLGYQIYMGFGPNPLPACWEIVDLGQESVTLRRRAPRPERG